MVRGRCEESWSRTSALMAITANVGRKEPLPLDHFNPFSPKSRRAQPVDVVDPQTSVAILASALTRSSDRIQRVPAVPREGSA